MDGQEYTAPGKDASDIWMFLRHYADAGNEERLFGEEGEAALAAFAFDLETAGAWLLGKHAREVLAHGPDLRRSLESLEAILRPEIDPDGALRLVAQMPPGDRERQMSLLAARLSESKVTLVDSHCHIDMRISDVMTSIDAASRRKTA